METKSYQVQSGDTLSAIAKRELGSASKWRLLADVNHLTDPTRIRIGQVLIIPSASKVGQPRPISEVPVSDQPKPEGSVRLHVEGKTVFAIDEAGVWNRVGKITRKGLYRVGNHEPEVFIAANAQMLKSLLLVPSEIRVIAATAENEGNFDAVNTWDSHFLSFGIFQWTNGGAGQPGELAALLARLKRSSPDDFQHFFGHFGLDVDAANPVTGWLSIDGKRLVTEDDKNRLRDHLWAYRFCLAGMDEQVKAVQVSHALRRIRQFYFTKSKHLDYIPLSKMITSEFGVALMLDNHVNRPGYLFKCVGEAITACNSTPDRMANGSEALEREVIERYLSIRETFGRRPMTNAKHRGEVTAAFLARGEISSARNSYRSGIQ